VNSKWRFGGLATRHSARMLLSIGSACFTSESKGMVDRLGELNSLAAVQSRQGIERDFCLVKEKICFCDHRNEFCGKMASYFRK
jgi:hypothetical protein